MKNDANSQIYTADQLSRMLATGEDRTDWERVSRLTDDDVEAAVASDPDEAGMVIDWNAAHVDESGTSVRIDPDILDYFRQAGRGHAARINSVLRAYMTRAKA